MEVQYHNFYKVWICLFNMLDEILKEQFKKSYETIIAIKEDVYSKIESLSNLSLRVRRKLAEISLKYDYRNSVIPIINEGEETGMFLMNSPSKKSVMLREVLPTCFKDLAHLL
mgnify:CR=1 FL=1